MFKPLGDVGVDREDVSQQMDEDKKKEQRTISDMHQRSATESEEPNVNTESIRTDTEIMTSGEKILLACFSQNLVTT